MEVGDFLKELIHERFSGRHRACRKESNSGLKTATLMNNSSMNNTSMKERNSGLNGPNFMNNNSMNNYSKENKSDLKTATLDNNITMDNHTRSYILDEPVPHTRAYILDEPVPHIGVATLRPTPFRRIIQRLKDTTRKVVDEAKRKWNDHYDWTICYVPQPVRDGSSNCTWE